MGETLAVSMAYNCIVYAEGELLTTKLNRMKELELKLMAAITETMPRGEDGKIKDRLLHSELMMAVNKALRIHVVVGQSEQLPKNNRCVANADEICDCDTVCIDVRS